MKNILSVSIIAFCCSTAASFPTLAANDLAATRTSTNPAPPEVHTIIGRVVEVNSGDQLQVLLPDGSQAPLVLAGVKVPDENSAIGQKSKVWLANQLQGSLVSADCERIEGMRYCIVFPDDRDINRLSLYHGFSVFDNTKSTVANQALYSSAEKHAREHKLGVWAQQYVGTQNGQTNVTVTKP